MSAKITVFIPVYNRQRFIAQTIQSVLDQSFKDFQLLLVDDGSTDNSLEIMRSFTHDRITIVENERNLCIPKTRNFGLEHAAGEYLAILDSDDLMLKDRLKKQKRFLDKHSDYAGVGSWSRYIDDQDKIKKSIVMRPVSHTRIMASLVFQCAIHNRTFMARTNIVKQYGYNNDFLRCQDYELLYRLSQTKQNKFYNLPEVLVLGRKHDQQITSNTSTLGDQMKMTIARKFLNDLNISYTDNDLWNHIRIARNAGTKLDKSYVDWTEQWLHKLLEANANMAMYHQIALQQICFKMWLKVITRKYSCNMLEIAKKRFFNTLNKTALSYLKPPYY